MTCLLLKIIVIGPYSQVREEIEDDGRTLDCHV